MEIRKAKLSELANLLGEQLTGDDVVVEGLGLCNRASAFGSILSYVGARNYADLALSNPAVKALILMQDSYEYLKGTAGEFSYIVTSRPEETFYRLHSFLWEDTPFYEKPSFESLVGSGCRIHPSVVIDRGVVIGNKVTIGANSVVNSGSVIGDGSYVGSCSVVGSQGFQILRRLDGTPYNVPHVGGTRIGKNVWIGDNVTVCNAIFEGCVEIGDDCQIDNHTQVAHNCVLGRGNVLTAGVILLGSAELKNNCWLAPGSLVMNRVVVEDSGFVGVNSAANTTVKAGTTVIGTPAVEKGKYVRQQFEIRKLIKQNTKKNGCE